jgi:hypothetical protein
MPLAGKQPVAHGVTVKSTAKPILLCPEMLSSSNSDPQVHNCSLRTRERRLALWLRGGGLIEICAFATVILPTEWLARTHVWLGMGEFPRAPVLEFMIRQSSFVYGMHGLLLWFVATDIPRFLPVIRFLGLTFLAYGAAFLVIDWWTAIPLWWTICDPLATGAFGGLLLWYARPDGVTH